MGKTKPVKKPSSPLKISTSLFRRRTSKNSTGQVDRESVPSSSSSGKHSKGVGKVAKPKGGKTVPSSSVKGKASIPTSTKDKESAKQSGTGTTSGNNASGKKKSSVSTPTSSSSGGATTKKGAGEGKLTQGKNQNQKKSVVGKKQVKVVPGKAKPNKDKGKVLKEKEKEKSPSPRTKRGTSSSHTSTSTSGSDSSSSSGSEAEKISTRKRSKSNAESQNSPRSRSPSRQKMAKGSTDEGESSGRSSSSSSSSGDEKVKRKTPTAAKNKNKKIIVKTKTSGTSTAAARKVIKKVTAKAKPSIVASKKKKPPAKSEKVEKKEPVNVKGKNSKENEKGKKLDKKDKTSAGSGAGGSGTNTKGKSKVKPKPKIKLKRMASLNAKAILEASFSFEPQEKKHRSPAPSSSSVASKVKGLNESGKDANVKSVSVSTSTSPPPLLLPTSSSSHSKSEKVSGERKRKSSETPSHREISSGKSSSSNKDGPNHLINGAGNSKSPKASSRRNSSVTPESESPVDGKMSKKSRKETTHPNKMSKVSSVSTSTGTSPLLSSEFYPEEKQKKSKKKEKSRGVDSGTNTCNSSGDFRQEKESHRVKAGDSHTKEKKSVSSSVSHFGTVYQPAGPLIEPHKTSVPTRLLPETVKLPPDLKVTYQTHPPTQNQASTASHSSSSKASKKHSSSTNTSSHSSNSHAKHPDKHSGQILHQPYKSSSSSKASGSSSSGNVNSQFAPSSNRAVPQSYPSSSYVSAAAGSPHVLSSPSILSQQSAASIGHSHQQLSGVGLTMSGHHHTSGSSSAGSSQQLPQPSASAGNPSAGGLFYSTSTGFAPHHSPFAPCKYPMVPPDSYRTPSPYPNSFMYPPTTPQPPSQYFMTPFYTPPLTPNSNPVVGAGLAGVVSSSQQRPLSLSAHHHPAIAAATSFYQPQIGLPQPSLHPHPSNYLVASPHHSLQPTPAAPGHAGLFHLNPCTQPQPACPTESCPPNNTSNNKPLQPRQSSSAAPVVAAKYSKALNTRPIRPSNKGRSQQPPTFTNTPQIAVNPPITIQLINPNANSQNSQSRQLESAKTFTEQYSLPDDITITPIIVSSPTALILKNTSISVVSSSTRPLSFNIDSPTDLSIPSTKPTNAANKRKEKDIVHVIDPRSGQKTTIAKHISNRNLLAKNISRNPVQKGCGNSSNSVNNVPNNCQSLPCSQLRLKQNAVGKLNPDLDVIVINNNTGSQSCDDITENVKLTNHHNHKLKSKNSMAGLQSGVNAKKNNKSSAAVHSVGLPKVNGGQLVSRRVALADNDNNNPHKISPLSSDKLNVPFNYSLPPGISISPGVALNLANRNNITSLQNQNQSVRPMAVKNSQNSFFSKSQSRKRTNLNDCIDGLQQKRLKLLEDHNFVVNSNGSYEFVNGNVIFASNSNGRMKAGGGGVNTFSNNGFDRNIIAVHDTSSSSARVRDPALHRGGTVIKSSDAVVAVSAVVLDPETYHLTRNVNHVKGLKNGLGLNKGKYQQGRTNFVQTSRVSSSRNMNFGGSNSRVKGSNKSGFYSQRNTRSTAANSKIRTRLRAKPSEGGMMVMGDQGQGQLNSRSRSRLLRTRNPITGTNSNTRKSESDCSSTCTSRSNSAVRIITGNLSNGRLEKEKTWKYPTQAFINAVADLYQYRRNVMLRVPRAGVGIFPSANSINLQSVSGESSLSHSPKSSLSPALERLKLQLSPLPIGGGHGSISPNTPGNPKCVGSMAANAAKKRALVRPLSPASINGALLQLGVGRRTPKWSNGWRFEGDPYASKVFVNNDDQSVLRRCYPAMRHESGDVIQTRDCVLLKSGSKKNDLPYIAKIAALWENPADGEMMFSLLWYYRPEHTDMGRTREDMTDEIFASKHIDVNSVATIDDRCYVLTFNEYCRYRKKLKQLEEGLPDKPLLSLTGSSMTNKNAAAKIAEAVWSGRSTEPNKASSQGKISPEVVFFCRKVYDFRQKRIMKNPS